jgi:hypothetical protein
VADHSLKGTNFADPRFHTVGRHPPFNTAPVADSQRSCDPLFKLALARIAKGGGLIVLRAKISRVPGTVNTETPQPTLQPGLAERAIDTATDVSHTITELSEGLQAAVNRLSQAIATARRPGHPLSTVSAIIREAPLASLFVAFLLGIAVARRR